MMNHISMSGPLGGGDENELRDIHVKMSKKIAQLTKVIYQLNTKNEDNDCKIKYITEQHSLELEKAKNQKNQTGDIVELSKFTALLAEKAVLEKEKIQLNERIQVFEKDVLLLDDEKSRLLSVEEDFKKAQTMWKTEREQLKSELEKPKNNDNLNEMLSKLRDELSNEKDQHKADISVLKLQNTSLKTSHIEGLQQKEKEYHEKIEKLKGLHQREIEILKNEVDGKSSQISELAKNHAKNEKIMEIQKKQINQISRDLKDTKRSHVEDRKEKNEITTTLDDLLKEVELLRNQLDSSNVEKSHIESKLIKTSLELQHQIKQNEMQHKENIEKIAHITELEGNNTQLTLNVTDMNGRVSELTKKIREVEISKGISRDQNSKEIHDLRMQLKKVHASREIENETHSSIKQKLEIELEEASKIRQEREQNHRETMQKLSAHHQTLLIETEKNIEHAFEAEKENINYMNKIKSDKEKQKFNYETEKLTKLLEVTRLKHEDELLRKAKQLEELKNLLDSQSDQNLNQNTEIEYYKKRERQLESDKHELNQEIMNLNGAILALRKENGDYQTQITNDQASRQPREEKLSREAVQAEKRKWDEQYSRKLEILRKDLSDNFKKENITALTYLTKQKDDELAVCKKRWKESLQRITIQNSQLKLSSTEIENQKEEEVKRLRYEISEKISTHERIVFEWQHKLEKEKTLFDHELRSQLRTLEEKLLREKRQELESIEANFREDSIKMIESQRITINCLKSKFEENQQRQFRQLDKEHQDAIELLQIRMEEQHQNELDEESKRHEQDFLDIENQLECEKQKAKETNFELEGEIELLKAQVNSGSEQISLIQQQMEGKESENILLSKEIEKKKKLSEKLLDDKNTEFENLKKHFENEKEEFVSQAISDAHRRRQSMLSDFNKSQELLKGQIAKVTKEKEEFEFKYSNREPRKEDILLVEKLNALIKDRDAQLLRMEDEMKYYQLELVNREQNYNSMFSSNPNVGLIDPFNRTKMSSSGSKTRSTQRQCRFTEQFVKVEPSLLMENPPARLEPIQTKKTVR